MGQDASKDELANILGIDDDKTARQRMEPLSFFEEDGKTRYDRWTKRPSKWYAIGVLINKTIRDEMALFGGADETNGRMMPAISK